MWFKIIILLSYFAFILTKMKETQKKTADFKWTGIECFYDNDFFVNVSCAIRAVKGQFGILEVNQTIAKELYDIRLNLRLLYKFGTIYRPYLIDFTVDICKMFAKDALTENNVEAIIKKATSTVRNEWIHPCPYRPGSTKIKWSGDQTFSTLISSFKFVLPAGDHKWEWRLYDSKNHTYLSFTCKATIKALGLVDLSMLSMGK